MAAQISIEIKHLGTVEGLCREAEVLSAVGGAACMVRACAASGTDPVAAEQ